VEKYDMGGFSKKMPPSVKGPTSPPNSPWLGGGVWENRDRKLRAQTLEKCFGKKGGNPRKKT